MNIAFRADASSAIGTGHIMRCLALADALASRGASVSFVCRHLPEGLVRILEERRFSLYMLVGDDGSRDPASGHLAHSAWLGTTQDRDAREMIHVLGGARMDWIIVDHYALDRQWESMLRSSAGHLMAIDDLADRKHDCDVLLDQNLYPNGDSRYDGYVSENCRLLLGPAYALLRDEFREWRSRTGSRSGVRHLLVSLGGVDSKNFTLRALNALADWDGEFERVDVVVGAQYPCLGELRSTCDLHGFSLHVQASNMAELMAHADLAIGAAGATSWERCCLGLPSLLVSLADNQVAIAKGLEMAGAGIYLGPDESISGNGLLRGIDRLSQDSTALMGMSERAYSIADGRGASRVCEILNGY